MVDVDVSSGQTSFQYVAGRDSEGLEYRCVSSGSSNSLTWMYNGTDEGSLLNAYQFYGRNNELTDYTVECHSSSGKIGEMNLTLKGENVVVSATPLQYVLRICVIFTPLIGVLPDLHYRSVEECY